MRGPKGVVSPGAKFCAPKNQAPPQAPPAFPAWRTAALALATVVVILPMQWLQEPPRAPPCLPNLERQRGAC